MAIEFRTSYPAVPRAVLDVYTDRRFASACAAALGALEHSTEVTRARGRRATDTRLVVATDGAPYLVEALVGERVPVRLTRAWTVRPGRGYDCAWELSARARSTAVLVRGYAELAALEDGAAYLAVAQVVELRMPQALRTVAFAAVEAVCERALANEAALALDWVTRTSAASVRQRRMTP